MSSEATPTPTPNDDDFDIDSLFTLVEFKRLKQLQRDVALMRRLQRQYLNERGHVLFQGKLKAERAVDMKLAQLQTMRSLSQKQAETEP